jgi:hypothetical protein
VNPHYPAVAARAGHRCEYCRAPEVVFNFAFEVEHVIPAARGGPDDDANFALACRACNLLKADALTGSDDATGIVVPLFHPRRDSWPDHFRVDPESGLIAGLTPTGRATVARLQMNRPLQLAARRQWARLGLFP